MLRAAVAAARAARAARAAASSSRRLSSTASEPAERAAERASAVPHLPAARGHAAAAAADAASAFADHLQRSPHAIADALAASLQPFEREALMTALLRRDAGAAGGPAATQALFARADGDGDGVISRDEFNAAAANSPSFRHVMQENAAAATPPTARDLVRVAAVSAVPFVGFGFCDNSIMILSGDAIESTVGVALSLSTMAAAGCGNMVSDVLGIGISGQIERACDKIGFRPRLSPAQMRMRRTQLVATASRCIGVGVGCVLGMFPLLLGSHDAALAAEATATAAAAASVLSGGS